MRWALAIGYAALILTVSSIPSDEFPVGMPLNIDKVAHAVEYAILVFLVCRAVRTPTRRALILIVLSCTIYGILDELHQHLIPGRFPSIWDAAADAVGCAITVAVWHVRATSRDKKRDQEGTGTHLT